MGLPERWRTALSALGLDEPAPEVRADCGACVMCSASDWTAGRADLAYRADVRCCSYTPGLWSFQVGAMLRDPTRVHPDGWAALEARIDGPFSAPLGLLPGEVGSSRYREAVEAGRFGRDPALRCPHLLVEAGRCAVWADRNATCATWFCRHERGAAGAAQWSALHHLLGLLEGWIAREAHARARLGGDGWSWPEGASRREVYLDAAAFADAWSWEDVDLTAPSSVVQAVVAYRAAVASLRRPPPARVRPGVWEVVARDAARVWLAGARKIDAVPAPPAVVAVLHGAIAPMPWADLVEAVGEDTAAALLDRGVVAPG